MQESFGQCSIYSEISTRVELLDGGYRFSLKNVQLFNVQVALVSSAAQPILLKLLLKSRSPRVMPSVRLRITPIIFGAKSPSS
jgi:hypothetical protein